MPVPAGGLRRLRRPLLPGVISIVLLAGCGSGAGGPDATDEAAAPGTGATTPAVTGPGPGVGGSSDAPAGGAGGGPGGINKLRSVVAGVTGSATPATTPAARTVSGTPGAVLMFVTPSKNIGCALTSDEVRCDIAERDWAPPARPASCEFDYGQGISVGGGPAAFVCAGDTALGGPTVLDYGLAAQDGDLQCLSAVAGVTCRNLRTGHGFTLSREAYALF